MHPYLAGAPPLAVAHRGAHGDGAGENAFEAFAHAVDLGFRYVETDVHRTADGVVVAMHDPTLERTTDGAGPLAGRAWPEIARARVLGGGRVPTLRELLDAWPDVRWNIDCKAPAAAADLLAIVREHGAFDRVCIGAFDAGVVGALREAAGEALCTAATRTEVRRLLVASRLPPFARRAAAGGLRCDAVQVPVEHEGTRIVTPDFVDTCHDVGLPVHVWTVDDEAEMRALLAMGVDGLMTDRAPVLRDVLAERGAWPPRDRRDGDLVAPGIDDGRPLFGPPEDAA